MNTVQGDLTLKLEKNLIYIQHVEGIAFTMKQIRENEW